MPAQMSMDLRLRIVRAVEGGSSIREAARRFAVTPPAAIKLMQRVRATGSAAPDRYGGYHRPLLGPHESTLRQLLEATPDLTLAELQTELQRRCGVRAGLSTIHHALRRLGLLPRPLPLCLRRLRTAPGAAGTRSRAPRPLSSHVRASVA